jgi:predicted dehydrogenase
MRSAIIGCGYVADFYLHNLAGHPDFEIIGVYDEDHPKRDRFGKFFSVPIFPSLESAIADPRVELVFNLTNPRSHFAVSSAALRAGKHVYTEKPLGMTVAEAKSLVAIAQEHGVRLGTAPCNLLSDTIQDLWRAIRSGVIGKIRLVYANYDDGMIAPMQAPWNWKSPSGAAWPAKDEFEVGCVYEHAGYFLTVLAALFGPARSVTAFASVQIANKGIAVETMAPDFSVGVIEYDHGVVARVTAGIVAPVDKSLTIVGDKGVLVVPYLRNDRERILIGNIASVGWLVRKLRRAAQRFDVQVRGWPLYRTYGRPSGGRFVDAGPGKPVDFLRGPQEMIDAIRAQQPHQLSGELGAHIVEVIEALQYPDRFGRCRVITSSFAPLTPSGGQIGIRAEQTKLGIQPFRPQRAGGQRLPSSCGSCLLPGLGIVRDAGKATSQLDGRE